MTEEIKNNLRVSFQKLSPQEGDVIVMRFPVGSSPSDRGYLAEMLSQMKEQDFLPPEVAIIMLPEGYNIEVLSEEQMGNFGWMRKLSS